ncbi:MAG: PTS sugar transporter subunit IIA [Treponema sp.]|jgi:mannitol/fructose-specific phosphotransferase system IIA component (Ntr-type)|nr:PTS sugar transporter subunit IIA [Treponema sp.]
MQLSDIFRPDLIKLDLESKTKDEVFKELVETIARVYPKFNRQEMVDAVISRENRLNTAILPGVAVPHGYCQVVNGIIGALGFSRTGIEYGSLEPVHTIFMLLMDVSSREYHLRVLSRLLEMLNSKSFAVIPAAESPQEVYDMLYCF